MNKSADGLAAGFGRFPPPPSLLLPLPMSLLYTSRLLSRRLTSIALLGVDAGSKSAAWGEQGGSWDVSN